MVLSPLGRTPVTEEALEQVRELIVSGKIPVGHKLPPEYQLVSMLGISRPTVREVLVTLQAEGYIEIRRGKGAFVIDKADFDRNKFIDWFKNNEFKIQELIEVRMGIEPMAAYLAANRITPEELEELGRIHQDFGRSIQNQKVEEIVRGDEQFHELILKASQNELLYFMYSNFIPALQEYRSRAFSPPANPNLATEAHEKIYQEIINRNQEGAFQAMLSHIRESNQDIVETAQSISSMKKE